MSRFCSAITFVLLASLPTTQKKSVTDSSIMASGDASSEEVNDWDDVMSSSLDEGVDSDD